MLTLTGQKVRYDRSIMDLIRRLLSCAHGLSDRIFVSDEPIPLKYLLFSM